MQDNVYPLDVTVHNKLINSDRLLSAATSTQVVRLLDKLITLSALKLQYCGFELSYVYYMNLGNNLGAAPSPRGSIDIVGV